MFSVDIAKFWRLPILKNICERLLPDCFNSYLIHRPKFLRCILHDSVWLQGPSHRSSFLLLFIFFVLLLSWSESRPAFGNLRRISLMSQLIQFLDLGLALSYFTPKVFRVTHHDKLKFDKENVIRFHCNGHHKCYLRKPKS